VINQSNRARFAFVALSIIAAAALPTIAHNAMSRATESLLQDNATANGETRETQYLEASAAAMAKMMRNMQVRPTGDVDRDAHPPFAMLKTLDTGPITNHVNFAHTNAGLFAYVTIGALNEVKVFRTDNFEQVAAIPVGELPHGVWEAESCSPYRPSPPIRQVRRSSMRSAPFAKSYRMQALDRGGIS
jgi:hypothetical protein